MRVVQKVDPVVPPLFLSTTENPAIGRLNVCILWVRYQKGRAIISFSVIQTEYAGFLCFPLTNGLIHRMFLQLIQEKELNIKTLFSMSTQTPLGEETTVVVKAFDKRGCFLFVGVIRICS